MYFLRPFNHIPPLTVFSQIRKSTFSYFSGWLHRTSPCQILSLLIRATTISMPNLKPPHTSHYYLHAKFEVSKHFQESHLNTKLNLSVQIVSLHSPQCFWTDYYLIFSFHWFFPIWNFRRGCDWVLRGEG